MRHDISGTLALFVDPAAAARAVRRLHACGFVDVRTESPAPYPELEAALRRGRSRLGWITLSGGAIGAVAGFALTIYTSLDLPLIVGGKPVVSIPPFVIIAFALAVLVGGSANFCAVVLGGALARRARPVLHDERSVIDRVGVFVPGETAPELEALLRSLGAEEVRQ